ncbi:MAG: aryl-sulfate sulfotransferase, partial [Candidatus Hermodarchaeota archaeon]
MGDRMRTCHTLLALVRRQLNGPAVVGLLSVVLIFSMVFLPDAQIMVAMNQDGSKGPGGSELSLTAPPMIDTKHAAETFMTTIHGADVSVTYTEEAYDGYNLFVLAEVGTSWSMTLLITDMRGNVVYEKDLGGQEPLADMPIEFINSTTLLGGDTYGAFLHNIYTNQTVRLPIMGHHEYEYNARNNTFFTFVNYDVSINGTLYRYDMLYEYDMLGNITWSLDTQSFIPPSHWCPYREMKGSAGDVTHSNTIFYDDVEDVIYYLSRNTNTMYKINHSDGAVLWGLGEYGDFRQYDEDGHRKHSLFYHAHAVERIDEDTFIIFDNDVHNQDDYSSYSSAMLEIDINESTMTANVSWAWRASKPYWCIRWGDADRLPNGNRLGTFGTEYHLDTNLCARLVEVNNAGQIVWKMDFHRTNNYKYGVYRMERIHFAPILNSPEDLVVDARNPVNLTWSAWYNYRPKRETTGEYNVYLDEVQVDSGNVTFDPYWRPTNIDVSLGVLTHGEKNVTIQIFDEGGHYSTDSVLVNVSGFHVVRHGSTTIETGQEQHTLRWKGFTFNPVFCNITVNGTLHDSFDWNGTDIELDLMSLGLGSHYIELKMFNDSVPIYTDTLWAYVLVSEPPQVISSPGDTALTWGNTPILTWEVFDNTPDEWQVFVNGTSTGLHEWNIPPTQINWTFPVLDEGIYNVTLMLRDQPGYNVAHTVLVTVLPPPIPIISAQPPDQLVVWGTLGVVFQWEVHGGYSWAVYKNS